MELSGLGLSVGVGIRPEAGGVMTESGREAELELGTERAAEGGAGKEEEADVSVTRSLTVGSQLRNHPPLHHPARLREDQIARSEQVRSPGQNKSDHRSEKSDR